MPDSGQRVPNSVTISQFVAVLRQRWHVIGAVVALCVLRTLGLLSTTPATYTAAAVVRVTPADQRNCGQRHQHHHRVQDRHLYLCGRAGAQAAATPT